jgi:hypothetical protein
MKLSVGRGRRASLTLAACWTITGIAAGALGLADGFSTSTQQLYNDGPSWPAGPVSSALVILAIGYLLFWLSLPVIVLFVGFGQLQATSAPGSWQGMWITAVLGGFALDAVGWWANNTTYTGDGFEWPWLMISIGYLVVGVATTVLLVAAPRPSAAVPAPGPS